MLRLFARAMSSSAAKQHLASPLQLGDLTLRNRNVMASLTRSRSIPTNVPNDINKDYYTQRAAGGAGLILSEGTLISQQGTEWPNVPGIWSDPQVDAWKSVTDGVHSAGGLIFCQLWHVGRVAHPDMKEQKQSGKPVYGPSAIAARGGKFRLLPGQPGYVTPTELKDPKEVVEEFRHAAQQAKRAGFDGVELHSANGYLIHQFLDTNSNKRTDEWGGSIENRCRLGLEAMRALIDVWGPARVGIKLSPCAGYNDVGMPLPDTLATFTHYITQISAMKPAYIQLVRYAPLMDQPIASVNKDSSSGKTKRGTPHDVLASYGSLIKPPPEALKEHSEAQLRGSAMPTPEADKANPSPTRLFINGGLTPDEAGSLVEQGLADAAVFGALWIGNPDLQRRIELGLDVGGKGINEKPNPKTFYAFPEGKPEVGYTDYPPAEQAKL